MSDPLPEAVATLNENALGEPIWGSPDREKRMRSIALASVTVPTVERMFAPSRSLINDDRRRQACEQVHIRPRQTVA